MRIEDLRLGYIYRNKKSNDTWVLLAIVDQTEPRILSRTPLLVPVCEKGSRPYVVMAGFSLERRCDDAIACSFDIDSIFLDSYEEVDTPPIQHYDEMS